MVDWWLEVGLAMASFLDRHGLLAAFGFLLIEEAGVPVPVPGDVLMLILGVQARQGRVELWQAILVLELGTVIGATFLYIAARLAGRGLVYRYGRFIRLTPERLDKTEGWLKRHGTRAIFLGRIVPGLRIVTAVACGVFEIPPQVFLPAMSVGALIYIVVYTLLGYFLGPPVLRLLEQIHIPFALLGPLVPLAVIVVWTVRARRALARRAAAFVPALERDQRLRAGAIAGGLATIGSTLFLNVVINLAGNLAFDAPGTIVEETARRLTFAFARDLQPLALLVAVPAFLLVGVLWGALYGLLAIRWQTRAPDWIRGVTYALLPLAVSVLLIMPLLGMGILGVGATGPVAFVGELLRHLAYGLLLGLSYPIFDARQSLKVPPQGPEELPAASAAI